MLQFQNMRLIMEKVFWFDDVSWLDCRGKESQSEFFKLNQLVSYLGVEQEQYGLINVYSLSWSCFGIQCLEEVVTK